MAEKKELSQEFELGRLSLYFIMAGAAMSLVNLQFLMWGNMYFYILIALGGLYILLGLKIGKRRALVWWLSVVSCTLTLLWGIWIAIPWIPFAGLYFSLTWLPLFIVFPAIALRILLRKSLMKEFLSKPTPGIAMEQAGVGHFLEDYYDKVNKPGANNVPNLILTMLGSFVVCLLLANFFFGGIAPSEKSAYGPNKTYKSTAVSKFSGAKPAASPNGGENQGRRIQPAKIFNLLVYGGLMFVSLISLFYALQLFIAMVYVNRKRRKK